MDKKQVKEALVKMGWNLSPETECWEDEGFATGGAPATNRDMTPPSPSHRLTRKPARAATAETVADAFGLNENRRGRNAGNLQEF